MSHRSTTTTNHATESTEGRVVAIAGPVVDVEFPPENLPEINHAVELDIEMDGQTTTIMAEVAQQIGEGRVRCICMKPTDGLRRGDHGSQHRPGHHGAGRRRRARPRLQRQRQPLDTDHIAVDDYWEIHRPPPPSTPSSPRR